MGKPLAEDVDPDTLADITYGFVDADIASLSKEAAMHALREFIKLGMGGGELKEAMNMSENP
jgi:SpoVK/Ycf46/Vps4 family AAA+-type ATPase